MNAHPPQRQTAAVYRRRRITVLVALIVIIALLWWGVSALFGPSGDAAAGAGANTTPEPQLESSEGATPEASADATEAEGAEDATHDAAGDDAGDGSSPEPTESASAVPEITDCVAEAIAVSVGTEPAIVADRVTFEAEVTNNGDVPCLFAGDGDNNSLLITSGDTRVWNSADCEGTAAIVGKRWVLDSGAGESFDVSWPRTWSFEGCTEATGTPQPGAYWAALTVGGIGAERIQFVM